jgi:hypothetical protein
MPTRSGKKWSFGKWATVVGLIFTILSFLVALWMIPELHDPLVKLIKHPLPPKPEQTIPDQMIGTWEGPLYRDSQHPTEKPNVCVIYELAPSGSITFRDNCTYELTDDATYPKDQIAVAKCEIMFDEDNPSGKDTSQVRMKRVREKLFVSPQYKGQPYLDGELHRASVPLSLSQIPRLSKDQCSELQRNPSGPIQGVPGPKLGCPDY